MLLPQYVSWYSETGIGYSLRELGSSARPPSRVKFSFFTPLLAVKFREVSRFGHPNPGKSGTRKISLKFHAKFHDAFSEGRKWGVRFVVVEIGVLRQKSQNPLKIGIWGSLD